MYRVGLENILGFTKVGDTLRIAPCVPRSWPGYAITYRFGRSTYEITVRNPAGVQDGGALLTVDGARHSEQMVRLVDDGQRHVVVVDAVPAGTE